MKTFLLYMERYTQIIPNNNIIFFHCNDTTKKAKVSRNNYTNRKCLIKIVIL